MRITRLQGRDENVGAASISRAGDLCHNLCPVWILRPDKVVCVVLGDHIDSDL